MIINNNTNTIPQQPNHECDRGWDCIYMYC